MTDFKSYPSVDTELSGKVSGQIHVWFRGDGSVGARTEAYINGPRGGVAYRDDTYLLHIEFRRLPDGTFVERGELGSVRRQSNWSDAPRTYRGAIIAAIAEHLESVWTPELEREGLEADVAQDLHRLEETERQLAAELKDVRKRISAAKRRL